MQVQPISVEEFLMKQIQENTLMLELVQRRSAMAQMEQENKNLMQKSKELEARLTEIAKQAEKLEARIGGSDTEDI